MEQVYHFDFVHDTQAVFRQLLSAVAHPMKAVSIARQTKGFSWEHPELWAVGCTLMDNTTCFYVEKDAELGRALADLTLARHAAPSEADHIFLSSTLNYDTLGILFQTAKKGTLSDPHRSATFLIFCPEFEGDTPLTVSGPGIKGERELLTTPYIRGICELQKELNSEYPCGIDLFFVSGGGELMALPRLCRAQWDHRTSGVEPELKKEDTIWHTRQ